MSIFGITRLTKLFKHNTTNYESIDYLSPVSQQTADIG